ncbi:PaaX domain-containing protein, C- domain protein [Aeromicrobium sp. A1-2]|uniref:PaaX family transcriptional regulator C-terminal domain-containing protein n=1 Tax=Aeromicrobium sp. A1-2 TaxID=2107713 RepID=UPI000E4D774D|nr:PaaX family transcriptional regulator C-terminal domain-containing protein [Aeromicrobium sp. A1-2]AXT84215.1 PaaX domain-containing protein, C- domain protein [Aeromicrobium sp. A1-2]
MTDSDEALLSPLPARSVILSLMMGSDSHRITSRQVAEVGHYFGISAATLRVALTRGVASGDLLRADAAYVLGPRLAARQRHQDEAVQEAADPWSGEWEMAVITAAARPGSERAALRETLTMARLAELREGTWCRPANLRRSRTYLDIPVLTCFQARPESDPADLARRLWDLGTWAKSAEDLAVRLRDTQAPAIRLAVGAQVVRHLNADPLLPAELRPPGWPGADLRAAYAAYQRDLRALTRP